MITTEVLRAAERVREQCQVRTVHAKDKQLAPEVKPAGAPMPMQHHKVAHALAFRPRVKELLEKGITKTEISRLLGISLSAVKRHAVAIKAKSKWITKPQAVEIDGVRYDSRTAAQQAHNIGNTLMYKWLKEGKAKRV